MQHLEQLPNQRQVQQAFRVPATALRGRKPRGVWRGARLEVLAVDALAVVGAEDGGLEALAVLLQAAALLAVAPLVVACRRALNSNVSPLLHSALCIHVLSEQWQGEQHFIMETLYPAGSAGGDILKIASSVLLTGSLSPAICNPRNDLV